MTLQLIKRPNYLVDESTVILHQRIRALPNVRIFLKSVAKNSHRTGITYETSLTYFQSFLDVESKYDLQTVLEAISKNEINVYTLLEQFVTFLTESKSLSAGTVRQYLVGFRSYLAYYDIDVIPSKFRRKVKMPRILHGDQEALDVKDIRNILLNCSNRRLKTFILLLASGGMRASECLAIRLKDCDFSVSPTKIHVRAEFSKTRVSRDIYISNEATKYLQSWISWKYRHKQKQRDQRTKHDDDLIFQVQKNLAALRSIYVKLGQEFDKVLSAAGLKQKKEGMKCKTISFHSYRRFVKSVISDQVSQDYSEWFLGHAGRSVYYQKKEPERREIYATKCMRYLTFLDYSALENSSKGIISQLDQKDREITYLREIDLKHEKEMQEMREQMNHIVSLIQENPKLAKVKTDVLSKSMKK
jgi:integrase